MMSTIKTVALLGTLTLGAGCVVADAHVPLDPGANFTAHGVSGGIVVDRMDDGQCGRLVSNYIPFVHRPPYLIEEGNRRVAELWRDGSTYTIRAANDGSGPTLGEIVPEWAHHGLRLAFHPAEGEAFHTGAFHRQGWTGPELLGQPVTNVLDLPGVYLAEVRDPSNKPVGWMRVEIGRYGPVLRLYEASLPSSISGPLALAAFKRVDTEIDWVEDHAMINPYIGN